MRLTVSVGTICVWEVLVDLDGFFFEARSTYEILGKLLTKCFAGVLQREIQEKDIWNAMHEQGVRLDWIETRRAHRILFFHTTAPWLAAKVRSREPLRLDWIVLKRNVVMLDHPEDFMEFDCCREIYSGLNATLQAVESWIENEINKLGKTKPTNRSRWLQSAPTAKTNC